MRSMTFMLAMAVSDAFLSGVVASNAVLARSRTPAPIADKQLTVRDARATSQTSTEKGVDELDRQLGRKLNVCRGC